MDKKILYTIIAIIVAVVVAVIASFILPESTNVGVYCIFGIVCGAIAHYACNMVDKNK